MSVFLLSVTQVHFLLDFSYNKFVHLELMPPHDILGFDASVHQQCHTPCLVPVYRFEMPAHRPEMLTTESQCTPSRAEPSFGSQPGMRAAPPGWKDWLAALLRSVDGARPSSPWAQSSSSVGADGRPGDLCGPGSAVTHRHGPAGRSSTRSGRTRDSSTRQPLGKVLVKSRKTAHKSQAGGSHLKMPVPYISHSLPGHVELVTIRKESGTKLRGNCTQEIFS